MQKSHYDASIDYLITIKYSFKGESIMTEMQQYVEDVLAIIQRRDPEQTEFQNAAREVLTSLVPMLEKEPKYKQHHILERIIEPERVIIFRVPYSKKGIVACATIPFSYLTLNLVQS